VNSKITHQVSQMKSAINTKAEMCAPTMHGPVQCKSAMALLGIRNYCTSNEVFSRSHGNSSQNYIQFSHSRLPNTT